MRQVSQLPIKKSEIHHQNNEKLLAKKSMKNASKK